MKKILSVLVMLTILVAGCSSGSDSKEASVCKGDVAGVKTEVTVEKKDEYVSDFQMKMTLDMENYGIDKLGDDGIKEFEKQVKDQYDGYDGVTVEANFNKDEKAMVVKLGVDFEIAKELPADMSNWGSGENLSKVKYEDYIKKIEKSGFDCSTK